MFDKERLLKISMLDSVLIKQMDDSRLNVFSKSANSFIDEFPAQEENIKNALKTKDRSTLGKSLSLLYSKLKQIHAGKLTEKHSGNLEKLEEIPYEDLQSLVIDFLKAVSALSIDLQMVEHQVSPAPPPQVPKQTKSTNNNILAVDDANFFLMTIKAMLQCSGYKVTCINTGAAALNYLKNNSPGLFILDIEMPEMDGYELARKIRGAGHSAPIIFLTGNSKKDSVIKAIQAGANDFIVKPVNKDQLLERLGKYIKLEASQKH
ncbi:MAG: response regulator [Oscillospiraceae bacterium]|jgi:PleD family two-component response regulator|nr:response regulator [Oscillospiraceae bacterium]